MSTHPEQLFGLASAGTFYDAALDAVLASDYTSGVGLALAENRLRDEVASAEEKLHLLRRAVGGNLDDEARAHFERATLPIAKQIERLKTHRDNCARLAGLILAPPEESD